MAFVKVSDTKSGQVAMVPVEEDTGNLSILALQNYFPHADGLCYMGSGIADGWKKVTCANGYLHAPNEVWGNTTYLVTYKATTDPGAMRTPRSVPNSSASKYNHGRIKDILDTMLYKYKYSNNYLRVVRHT